MGSLLTENHSFLSASMTSFLAVAGIRKLWQTRPDHKEALTTWPGEHLHGIAQGMPSPEDPVVGAGHDTDDVAVHLVYSDFGRM